MQPALTHIFRYPVKSMGGHALEQTELQINGIPGDRCWTLKDEERGGIKGGKRFPELMAMQAELCCEPNAATPSPEAHITLPDGDVVSTLDPEAGARLTQAVGAPVSIWPLLPADQLDHYRRRPPEPDSDPAQAMRDVFARIDGEPLPDLSQFPKDLFTYESPPGTYFDAFPLLLMSRASLQSMATAYPQSMFDVRRFRPNLVVDTDTEGFPEDAWAGKTATLGEATLKFEMPCPRCVMTTHGFRDMPKDPKVMRALVKENGGNLGVYVSVVKPGTVRVGDRLEFSP